MEKHHGVRISDAAVAAAVTLSQRYIPARQLPDKAVSLLDTACARVAISQSTVPAAHRGSQGGPCVAARPNGTALTADRISARDRATALREIAAEICRGARPSLVSVEAEWVREQALVRRYPGLRASLAAPEAQTGLRLAPHSKGKAAELGGIDPESRMIYPHVDEQSVASVVSDWTGIPVGRMVKDEIETVLSLAEILNHRVVGQSHGLAMIAKRIETNRAKLDNPNKPIGVFMLCGPSGVGKTETALALAEALYGGEQNMITINMSEFQEAHSVSTLKGAPPGYIGYGEGGRLTEAVRRKPYSVILLDEVEKAHPDVHEIFFQVFDKGADGGRHRPAHRLQEHAHHPDLERRHRSYHGGREKDGAAADATALAAALRPDLLRVFPPALIGRLVVIPYFPLSRDMLGGIVRLQLDRIGARIAENQGTAFSYGQAVVDHIVSLCNDPDSGGRMIDNIITNTLLPDLSRGFLDRTLRNEEPKRVRVSVKTGAFGYEWDDVAPAEALTPAPERSEAEEMAAE